MPIEIRELTIKVNVDNAPTADANLAQIEANMDKMKQEIDAEMAKLKAETQQRMNFER